MAFYPTRPHHQFRNGTRFHVAKIIIIVAPLLIILTAGTAGTLARRLQWSTEFSGDPRPMTPLVAAFQASSLAALQPERNGRLEPQVRVEAWIRRWWPWPLLAPVPLFLLWFFGWAKFSFDILETIGKVTKILGVGRQSTVPEWTDLTGPDLAKGIAAVHRLRDTYSADADGKWGKTARRMLETALTRARVLRPVKREAAIALAPCKDKRAARYLTSELDDAREDVEITKRLGQMNELAAPFLLANLNEHSATRRRVASLNVLAEKGVKRDYKLRDLRYTVGFRRGFQT